MVVCLFSCSFRVLVCSFVRLFRVCVCFACLRDWWLGCVVVWLFTWLLLSLVSLLVRLLVRVIRVLVCEFA